MSVDAEQTHDSKRNATTSLFAALNTAQGEVIGQCRGRHRWLEFQQFLAVIDMAVPPDSDTRLLLDIYGTHWTAMIHRGLARRLQCHLYFKPASASWISDVKRWLVPVTRK